MPNFRTIDDIAKANRGQTVGFDYLRIGLSAGVVIQHCILESNAVSGKLVLGNTFLWYFILPAFFALSGYLVIGSLFRNSIAQFAVLRVLRIVPALAVEITLSALFLGVMFTQLPLVNYFTSQEFFTYFLNIIGVIHYTLPGVFNGEAVNAQLWTIPYELRCYIFLIGVALITLNFQRLQKYFPIAMVSLATLLTVREVLKFQVGSGGFNVDGRSLELAFLWGCNIYLYRDRLPFSMPLILASLALGVILLEIYETRYLGVVFIAYSTVTFGLLKLPRIPFGDLSYGLFLFHYPIMQTLRLEFGVTNSLILTASTLTLSTLFGFASWKLIEKPILSRKSEVLAFVDGFESRVKRFFPSGRSGS